MLWLLLNSYISAAYNSLIRSINKSMTAETRLLYYSAQNALNKIIFIIDKICYPVLLDYVNDTAISIKAVSSDRITEKLPKTKNYARSPNSATTRSYMSIQSLLCKRPASGKAGNIIFLDYWIANYSKTTSTYKKLLYRIQFSKYILLQSSEQQVKELTREKSFLLQKLIYFKIFRATETKLFESIIIFCTEIEKISARLRKILNKKSKTRIQTEINLCSY